MALVQGRCSFAAATLFAAAVIFIVVDPVVAGGEAFLGAHAHSQSRSTVEDFRAAMGTVMGCGGSNESNRLVRVEKALLPMWQVLPKNGHDLVEWPMVRYIAHRYFMQQSSLMIRGFEPMRQLSPSQMGNANILNEHVSLLVDGSLQAKRSSNGFSLEDTVAMVSTLEQLISDAESTLLEKVYTQQQKAPDQGLNHQELTSLVEAYMINWMMDDDQQAIQMLLRNSSLLQLAFPNWKEVKFMVGGLVKSMEFARHKFPQPGHAQAAMVGQYSFDDAHEVVGGITKKFASFWEGECQVIKEALVAMDKANTGRVLLSDFYGANSDGAWNFGESEVYLRELGALDESSPWRGTQVIIPNYLQAASNCIAATPHYLVCCANECESILNEIEDAVGAPFASPEEVLLLVGNMSGFDDEMPKLDATLKAQLSSIFEKHNGTVPLHGRLFAQWLHFVFPRECAFPHRVGVTAAVTPSQFGDKFVASATEISTHASARDETDNLRSEHEEAQWMSQWSEEEELIGDSPLELSAPWESRGPLVFAGIALIALIAVAVLATRRDNHNKPSSLGSWGVAFERKSHYV